MCDDLTSDYSSDIDIMDDTSMIDDFETMELDDFDDNENVEVLDINDGENIEILYFDDNMDTETLEIDSVNDYGDEIDFPENSENISDNLNENPSELELSADDFVEGEMTDDILNDLTIESEENSENDELTYSYFDEGQNDNNNIVNDPDFENLPGNYEEENLDSDSFLLSDSNENNLPPMTEEELGRFVDWENAQGNGYYDVINDITNDESLTDEQKYALIQPMLDELQQFENSNYVDADTEEEFGPVKVLRRDPQSHFESGSDLVDNNYDTDAYDAYTYSGGDIQNISDIDNWIGDINPNFDEFDLESPYSNNCGSCAYAVYQRLEGSTDSCASAENIGYNDEMKALTGMEQVSMSPEEIESRLLEQGEGAHAIIGIDRAEGAGHWFNAACIDGKVVAIDGQTGEINDWPPDYGDVVNWEMSVKKGA